MFNASVVKTVTALLVTATMAIPAPLWAKNLDEGTTTGATDGIPVIFEPVHLQDGRTGYLAMAPVPASQEAETVKTLAKTHNLTLAVNDLEDPALEAALESGQLPWVRSFIVGSADQANLIQAAKPSLKQRIKDKIKAITALCAKEKMGLIVAASVASISTSYVMYESHSVADGMKALVALFGWAAFQSMNSAAWDWYLDKGGETLTKMMSWAFGRDVTPHEMQMFETAGKFHASWLANSGVAAYVFISAGTFHGFNSTGLMQAFWYGFLGSTDIWDSNVSQKIKQGVWSHDFHRKFVAARIVVAAFFEVAGYLNAPHIQALLFLTTVAGILHLGFSEQVDPQIAQKATAVKTKSQSLAQYWAVAYHLSKTPLDCELALTKRPPSNQIASGR